MYRLNKFLSRFFNIYVIRNQRMPLYLTGQTVPSAYIKFADSRKGTEQGLAAYLIDTVGNPISPLLFHLTDADIRSKI